MAIQGPIPISFEQVFPHGCYIVGEVEQVKDFDASTNGRTVYAKDKNTGELVWQVAVMDADPTVKAGQKTVVGQDPVPGSAGSPGRAAGPAVRTGGVRRHDRHRLRRPEHRPPGLVHPGTGDARSPHRGSGQACDGR